VTNNIAGNKTVYRFEERIEEQIPAPLPPPPMGEREEIIKTEWINPPTVIMTGPRSERARTVRGESPGARTERARTVRAESPPARTERARTVRAESPSARSATTRRTSPARTTRTRSRRPSSPGTYVEERRTVFEERMPPPPPLGPSPEYYEERRTVIEERMPPPPPPGAPTGLGALVVRERTDYRSDRDIQSEIRQLEAERRALRLEREAEEKRAVALRIRPEEEYQLVEYRDGGRRRQDREVLEIVEREKSPARNVTRVEKDRKGRMALVRSAH